MKKNELRKDFKIFGWIYRFVSLSHWCRTYALSRVLCYVEFFVLRDISRHLYSGELYSGFAVTPFINIMTSAVFAIQAIALGLLIWLTRRGKAYNKSLNEIRARVE